MALKLFLLTIFCMWILPVESPTNAVRTPAAYCMETAAPRSANVAAFSPSEIL